jgi:predicted ATPase
VYILYKTVIASSQIVQVMGSNFKSFFEFLKRFFFMKCFCVFPYVDAVYLYGNPGTGNSILTDSEFFQGITPHTFNVD